MKKKKTSTEFNPLLEEWLDTHEVIDKDKPKPKEADPIPKNRPFSKLKPEKYNTIDPYQTKKFLTGDEDIFHDWIEKQDLKDKDAELIENELRMYPADYKIPSRIQEEIDLHGLKVAEAIAMVHRFVLDCFQRNIKVIKIIHGKGKHSKGDAKLKKATIDWLHTEGYSFVQHIKPADKEHGGLGATIVWLK